MVSEKFALELQRFAAQIRIETVKAEALVGHGHIGGTMSVADLLSVLYSGVMNVDPKKPKWEDRDWFVLSKGHCGPALYSALSMRGFFPADWLTTINKLGTRLPSHCDMYKVPGVDMTTGSLGQGMSMAIGVALANKYDKRSSTVYAVFGDGECQEGQIWEGALAAHQLKLDNFIGFVDNNKRQIDDFTKNINDLLDVRQKFEDFGWFAQDVDGHNPAAIYEAIERAKEARGGGRPCMIVLDTVKGHGCLMSEREEDNHHMHFAEGDCDESLAALQKTVEDLTRKISEVKS